MLYQTDFGTENYAPDSFKYVNISAASQKSFHAIW